MRGRYRTIRSYPELFSAILRGPDAGKEFEKVVLMMADWVIKERGVERREVRVVGERLREKGWEGEEYI